MKYYYIQSSLNKQVVGIYPQVEEAKYSCDIWNEPRFIDNLSFEEIDFSPITANAILKNGSKITDLISAGIVGFTKRLLVSGKLKSVLEKSKTKRLQFFNSPIIFKELVLTDYWLMNLYELGMNAVDFSASEVLIRKRKPQGGTYLEKMHFENADSFMKYLDGKLFLNKIKLDNNTPSNLFLLNNVEGGVKYVISEVLRDKILLERCSGLEFVPIELSIQEWLQDGSNHEKPLR